MELKVQKSHIYTSVYLFLMLYKPALFPVSMNYIMTFWGVAGCVFTYGTRSINRALCPLKRFAVVVFLVILYLGGALSITSADYSLLKIYVFMFGSIIQGAYAVVLLRRNYEDYESAMNAFVFVGLFQTIICVVMMILPNIRTNIVSYIVAMQGNSDTLLNAMSVRLYGIAGEYLYTIGLIHGVLSTYLFYCAIEEKKLGKAILAVAMLLPAILNARVGVVCTIISTLFLVVCCLIHNEVRDKIRLIKIIVVTIGVIVLFMNICRILVPGTYSWIQDGIQAVIDLILGQENRYYGKLTSDFLVWPTGKEFIIGKGVIPAGKNYMHQYGYVSDIGYVRDIHAGGLILAVIFYSGCVWAVLNNFSAKNYNQKVLSLAFVIFIAFANYKGRIAGSTDTIILILIIVGYCYFYEEWEESNES